MWLEVNFDNNETLNIDLTTNHTVNVIGPDNTVQDSFALGGVTGVKLHEGSAPVLEPTPVAEPDPADPNMPAPVTGIPTETTITGGSPGATIVTDPQGNPTQINAPVVNAPDPVPTPEVPVDPPAADGTDTAPSATSTDPVDPTPIVNTATDAVNDPTVPAEDALSVVKAAQADIQQALASHPDDAALLDAVNELSKLEADLTPPAA